MRRLALVLTCAALAALTTSDAIHVRAQAVDSFTVEAIPSQLWPPNHKMVPVQLIGFCQTIYGTCTRANPCACCIAFRVESVTANEPIQPGVDYEVANNSCPGPGTRSVPKLWLKATRTGEGIGRTYSVHLVECRHLCCNPDDAYVTVTVPHDQGKE